MPLGKTSATAASGIRVPFFHHRILDKYFLSGSVERAPHVRETLYDGGYVELLSGSPLNLLTVKLATQDRSRRIKISYRRSWRLLPCASFLGRYTHTVSPNVE